MTNEKQNGLAVEKPVAFKRGHDIVPELLPADKQKEKVTTETESEEKEEDTDKKKPALEADPETLLITDPQENMEGPISSIMQNIKEAGEATDVVSKEEADRKKEKNL